MSKCQGNRESVQERWDRVYQRIAEGCLNGCFLSVQGQWFPKDHVSWKQLTGGNSKRCEECAAGVREGNIFAAVKSREREEPRRIASWLKAEGARWTENKSEKKGGPQGADLKERHRKRSF